MASLQERLTEAQDALHDLVIGKAVVRCRDADGSEVTYTQATRSSLMAYIAKLERDIAASSNAAPCYAPMRLIF
ncbi:gpW family head-tail joining protein [Sphingobium lignivorans]|uniref:Phage tail protein n=1 Tax=Sphingobium lignivorans TaxID=2735886 RepID=A0ABR6NF61_9SPHN|nr:gpW family head-tail joining protein [Sphingobium lignivorans]MBB5985923.1 hypothetical protein [Sphingobium lignivorans]